MAAPSVVAHCRRADRLSALGTPSSRPLRAVHRETMAVGPRQPPNDRCPGHTKWDVQVLDSYISCDTIACFSAHSRHCALDGESPASENPCNLTGGRPHRQLAEHKSYGHQWRLKSGTPAVRRHGDGEATKRNACHGPTLKAQKRLPWWIKSGPHDVCPEQFF